MVTPIKVLIFNDLHKYFNTYFADYQQVNHKLNELLSVRKYKNIKTGNNISIYNNSFYSPIDVLYFTGQNGQNGNAINKIKNNRFVKNTIYNSKKRVKDTVFFREEVDNSNSISNNNIVIESK